MCSATSVGRPGSISSAARTAKSAITGAYAANCRRSERRLHQPPLPFVEFAFAGQQALAQQALGPLQGGALENSAARVTSTSRM